MEIILFIGIQATGKSFFFKENFFKTHMRVSMDLLNTRNKEYTFIEACYSVQQKFVVDNTNPQKSDRARYIEAAKANKYKVIGYYFQSKLEDCMKRNASREGKECISEVGIRATYSKLEMPDFDEGFDELYYVEIDNGVFKINEWQK